MHGSLGVGTIDLNKARILSILGILLTDMTTVKVRRETKRALAELGKKEDTYDTIIRKLIDFYLTNKNKVGRRGS